jgi:hypothetical protein
MFIFYKAGCRKTEDGRNKNTSVFGLRSSVFDLITCKSINLNNDGTKT